MSIVSIKNAKKKKTIYFFTLLLDSPVDFLKRSTMLDDKWYFDNEWYFANEWKYSQLKLFVSLTLALLSFRQTSL